LAIKISNSYYSESKRFITIVCKKTETKTANETKVNDAVKMTTAKVKTWRPVTVAEDVKMENEREKDKISAFMKLVRRKMEDVLKTILCAWTS
jgi:hypothetical protein